MRLHRTAVGFLLSSSASLATPQTTEAEEYGLGGDELSGCERSVVKIVWSCLAVIFACTWVSVHPNVPGDKERPFDVVWRKLSIMVDALLAPELVLFWAMRQWIVKGTRSAIQR